MSKNDGLNKEQRVAVAHKNGPLLVIAGAGSGKTRVIAERIANLVSSGISPQEILAITFTNKAAEEMGERIRRIFGMSVVKSPSYFDRNETPHISTFHSLGVYILRENYKKTNRTKNFTIFDRSDSIKAIKDSLEEVGYSIKQIEPKKILNAISRSKNNLLTHKEYADLQGGEFFPQVIARVWKIYEEKLVSANAYDFDDLLVQTVLLLKKNKNVLSFYRDKWKYIHIDEYQDTNTAQYELSRLLSFPKNNICVVGDNDQSIYSWRGADFTNILNFEKDYPNTIKVILSQNYRSTKNILSLANKSIKENKYRIEKDLFTENENGEKISIYTALDEKDEAQFIANTIKNIISSKKIKRSGIAILYRANFQSRVLEEVLIGSGVPYKVIGTKFFDRKEIKDIICFIKTAINPEDYTSFARIVNVPPRGIGKVTLAKIVSKKEDSLSPSMKKKVDKLRDFLFQINKKMENENASSLIKFILKDSGLEKHLKEGGEDGIERLENIRELVTIASRFDELGKQDSVQVFLDNVALVQDQDTFGEEDKVKLMTVHASKGLEFPHVFIAGLEEGLFPHMNLSDDDIDYEEERRLFYVAVTRAKKKLYLSYAYERTIFGRKETNEPSVFLTEIDDSLIQNEESDEIIRIE